MSKRFDFVNQSNTRHACEQGSTFSAGIYIKDKYQNPVDLTGYTFKMHVRVTAATTGSPLLEISTANGYGTITAATGKLSWTVPAAVTAAITAGNYFYDLEITSGGGLVTRIIEGKFDITAEVTR